jgi:hypothetical protein
MANPKEDLQMLRIEIQAKIDGSANSCIESFQLLLSHKNNFTQNQFEAFQKGFWVEFFKAQHLWVVKDEEEEIRKMYNFFKNLFYSNQLITNSEESFSVKVMFAIELLEGYLFHSEVTLYHYFRGFGEKFLKRQLFLEKLVSTYGFNFFSEEDETPLIEEFLELGLIRTYEGVPEKFCLTQEGVRFGHVLLQK